VPPRNPMESQARVASSARILVARQHHFRPNIFLSKRLTLTAARELPRLISTFSSSHANVHSQDRPHFCPVDGCPRGIGGKGFKRKNEMMRHGLVHNSPGYVCPFCPDQQHKYPRPDNLQRLVICSVIITQAYFNR